ncbi:DUF6179 domain-containing protein [Ruminococcaceae bacterium OttesenSCG-928-D13]|nr:DUF6179 domain-containing protein [Ruminococcaceae bacterium OttesenSCG-928-D13]
MTSERSLPAGAPHPGDLTQTRPGEAIRAALAGCGAGDYLERLVSACRGGGLLSAEGAAALGHQLAALLEKRAERYLAGESRSMRAEASDALLHSILYTLGIALKARDNPAEALLAERLEALFNAGLALLRRRTASAKRLWRAALNTRLPSPSLCYTEALGKGFSAFFHFYDVDYAADQTPADIDYPLGLPLEEGGGVEFAAEWLRRILLENRFCARFGPNEIHALMLRREADYATLPLNLFDPVLLCAIGCLATMGDPATLRPDALLLEELAPRLAHSSEAAGIFLREEAEKLCAVLGFAPGDALIPYAIEVAGQNAPVLRAAAEAGRLASFFGAPKLAEWEIM